MRKTGKFVCTALALLTLFISSCDLEEKKPDTSTVTDVTLNTSNLHLVEGGTETLIATVLPTTAKNKSVTWSSTNPSVATVTQDGFVTAVHKGEAIIKVTTVDGTKTAECTVMVDPASIPVTGITLNKTWTSLVVGGSETLIAYINPTNATNQNVTWRSDNPSVARVSNGVIIAESEGKAAIIVTTNDGHKSASCEVTVSVSIIPVTGVVLNKTSASLLVGGTETLHTTIAPEGATNQNVTWASNRHSVAEV
jgi:uncharacterized protein YjdB